MFCIAFYLHYFDIKQKKNILIIGKDKKNNYKGILFKSYKIYIVLLNQGDADYLRYRGMQEFDRAMQHLEEKFGVSLLIVMSLISYSMNYLMKSYLDGHLTLLLWLLLIIRNNTHKFAVP